MLGETEVPLKDTFMLHADTCSKLKSFVLSSIYSSCVLGWFILLLSNSFSCDILLDQTFRIEDSLDDKNCKIEHVHMSFSTTSDINCLFRCSDQLTSDGVFYNYNNETCTCCSELYTIPDELPTNKGTRYYTNTYKEGRRDCNDLGDRDFNVSGIYKIFPNGQDGVSVYCDFDDTDGPWTIIQRRVDDTVAFSRNYAAYQEFFGDLSGNFWLGLDAISSITLHSGKTYSLKVLVGRDDGAEFAEYTHFQVKNASENFTLNVDGYSGNAGDAMTYHDGAPFSTYDRDMDTWEGGNCADALEGAWWFKFCHKSNLNGLYGGTGPFIYWQSTAKDEGLITFSEMKIKGNKYI